MRRQPMPRELAITLAILVLAIAIFSGNGCAVVRDVERGLGRGIGWEIARGIFR